MITAGIDIGSLTAKAVLLEGDTILAFECIRVKHIPEKSAKAVLESVLAKAGQNRASIEAICATGYGRENISFADMNKSEISCHGMGAHLADSSIRTIIDIGGQDCKIIGIDGAGMITNFIMNDKCAAGTGRSLEMLAKTLGVPLEELGPLSLKSKRPLDITSKCSIFMELEVLDALYSRKKLKHIAMGLSDAVAKRIVALAGTMDIKGPVCLTGGVAKNAGVTRRLQERLAITFKPLVLDPQIIGALGAAAFAAKGAL